MGRVLSEVLSDVLSEVRYRLRRMFARSVWTGSKR